MTSSRNAFSSFLKPKTTKKGEEYTHTRNW